MLFDTRPIAPEVIAVTGPRRSFLRHSTLPLYLATPFGDMMLAGCYGLVRAAVVSFGERGDEADEELLPGSSDNDQKAPHLKSLNR
ncbi:MAG: hypothetical protein ACE5EQ_06760 [Phycisphaerae bacterium]